MCLYVCLYIWGLAYHYVLNLFLNVSLRVCPHAFFGVNVISIIFILSVHILCFYMRLCKSNIPYVCDSVCESLFTSIDRR